MAWNREHMGHLEEKGSEFRKILVKMLDEHRDYGLYTVLYYLSDHMIENIQTFETISVLASSPYAEFNKHIKKAMKRTLQKRERIEKKVSLTKRGYERELSYWKKT